VRQELFSAWQAIFSRSGSDGICFMSSAGPGLVAITKDKSEKAIEIFKKHNCKVVEIEPDNEGPKYNLFKK